MMIFSPQDSLSLSPCLRVGEAGEMTGEFNLDLSVMLSLGV